MIISVNSQAALYELQRSAASDSMWWLLSYVGTHLPASLIGELVWQETVFFISIQWAVIHVYL
jgi:hypothetical protein